MRPSRFALCLLLSFGLAACAGDGSLPDEDAVSPVTERVVFFGDSITEAGVRPGGYVSIVADSLREEHPAGSVEVIGAGVGGHKVPDLQARLERDVLSKDPTHVVIYIGINDVWHFHDAHASTGTEREAYEQGLRAMIEEVRQRGAEVSLCTPSVIGEDPDSDAPVNQQLVEYAAISRAVALDTGAHLCDLRAAFEDHLQTHNAGRAYEGVLTSDGVHLNEAGNRFVAGLLLEHLRPLLNTDAN